MKKLTIICGLVITLFTSTQINAQNKPASDSVYWFISWFSFSDVVVVFPSNDVFKMPVGTSMGDVWRFVSKDYKSFYYATTFEVSEEIYLAHDASYKEPEIASSETTWDIDYVTINLCSSEFGQGGCQMQTKGKIFPLGVVEQEIEKKFFKNKCDDGKIIVTITNFKKIKK